MTIPDTKRSTRIVTFGTGDFALPVFESLVDAGYHVVSLVTRPDRPKGRKQDTTPNAIKLSALARGVPVFQPEDVNLSDSVEHIRSLEPDVFATAAYGQILSAELLGVPKLGAINLHGSLLPAYRGAAPVARAIENGETEAGVTVIFMTPRIDAGGMLARASVPIDPNETAGELEDRLAILGAPLIVETIDRLVRGETEPLKQERARVTRAPKLRKEEGLIDWNLPAQKIHNLIRAMNPWPLASTYWLSNKSEKPPIRLIVHRSRFEPSAEGEAGSVVVADSENVIVAAGSGGVRLVTVQIEGKRPMPIEEFLRGRKIELGDRFVKIDEDPRSQPNA